MELEQLDLTRLRWLCERGNINYARRATKNQLIVLIRQNIDAVIDGVVSWLELREPSNGDRGYFRVDQLINSVWEVFCGVSGQRQVINKLVNFWPGIYRVRKIELQEFATCGKCLFLK